MTHYTESYWGLPQSCRLWGVPHTDTGIAETKVIDIYPQSSLESSDAISFTIPPIENCMLEKVHILTTLKVVQADGENLAADTNVSTIPYLAAGIWRNVEFSIGGVSLTQSFDNAYAMTQFWQTVLHTPDSCHFLKNHTEGLQLDNVTTKTGSESLVFYNGAVVNSNAKERADRIRGSNSVDLISELNVSILKQDKLLPPAIEYHVNLTKNHSEFILLEANNGTSKVVYEKVLLRCTFKRPADHALQGILKELSSSPGQYIADKTRVTFISIPNAIDHTVDLFKGILPYCFIIGVQDRSALMRTRNKNPFSLHPIKKVQLYTNGSEHFPRPIERTLSEYGMMYHTFLDEVGYPNKGDTLIHAHYDCYPAMVFALTPNKNINNTLNLTQQGTCRLSLELFNEAQNYVLMVIAFYEQIVEISKDGEVTFS